MLRYYEQMGLVESGRRDDYAYRVYDDTALKRLQQIIILRKLQIPIKQINIILNNPDAATAIDIFKKNVSEIQSEITSLETIKSALEIFIIKIEELASVRLNLNMLTDDSVLKLAESLSLIQKNVKENKIMDELNRSSESLDKLKEKFVRIVLLPPMTVASVSLGKNTPESPWQSYIESKDMMDKFIMDVDLLKIKPDFRYFGYGHDPYGVMVTIPEDIEVPEPLTKSKHPGGLFAAYTNGLEYHDDWKILDEWAKNNKKYEWEARCARLEEYFNPRNLYGLKNADLEYYDFLLPIKEVGNIQE